MAEFITEGKNGLLTPVLDPARLAERVLDLLEHPRLSAKIRKGARRYAEEHLSMENYLSAFDARIAEITGL